MTGSSASYCVLEAAIVNDTSVLDFFLSLNGFLAVAALVIEVRSNVVRWSFIERRSVLQEIDRLVDCDPDDIPRESRFLLEMDFQTLYHSSFEKQSYWVRAMKAARRAGRRAVAVANLAARQGASARRRAARRRTERLTINTGEVEAQLREDLNLPPLVSRRRPHPAHLETLNPINKRLRHPD